MGWHAAPRIQGFEYDGCHAYALTICTYRRAQHFRGRDLAVAVAEQFRQSAALQAVSILAYCIMPDHLHLVVRAADAEVDVRRFVTLAKQATGHAFAQATRQRLWQQGFFDRVLRDERDVAGAIAYCLANPVRAGLVEAVTDWSHWGSEAYSREALLRFLEDYRGRSG